MKNIRMKRVSAGKTLLFALCVGWGFSATALGEGNDAPVEPPEAGQVLIQGSDRSLEIQQAVPGSFLLPEAPGQDSKREKCMTVCARWGEDCMLINKGVGGMERKCRRTCKQFAEECF